MKRNHINKKILRKRKSDKEVKLVMNPFEYCSQEFRDKVDEQLRDYIKNP